MTAKVSFLVTVYNKRVEIPETLDSIRAQAARLSLPIEIICSDDASPDGSLEYLRAEAARDDRIRVIGNETNLGPAIRLNQAAAAASGAYFVPFDADDLAPENASEFMLGVAIRYDCDAVFGRAIRNLDVQSVPSDAPIAMIDEPLAYCARRQITHMGFMARAQTWFAAGGADEQVFIQDQSVQLRLCATAKRIAMIDAVVYNLRPAGVDNLSRRTLQQHHDRFLSAYHVLQRGSASPAAEKELRRQLASAMWKLRRDGGSLAPFLSREFVHYVFNRTLGVAPSDATLAEFSRHLADLPDIRRPAELVMREEAA